MKEEKSQASKFFIRLSLALLLVIGFFVVVLIFGVVSYSLTGSEELSNKVVVILVFIFASYFGWKAWFKPKKKAEGKK